MDNNRRFANLLPKFARSNGKLPAYADKSSIFTEQDRANFTRLCESHALPFVSQLWTLDLIHYREKGIGAGNIVISRVNVLNAAAQFLAEVKDCRYSQDYEIDAFNEARQCFYTHDNARKALINHKGYQAQAILLAAYLSGTRLTDAQRKWLESAANGRYLADKYAQYPSGIVGTLAPKVEFHGAYSGSAAQREDFTEYTREARIGIAYGKLPAYTPILSL